MTDFHDALTTPAKPPAVKRDQAEHGLSHWVDVLLDRVLLGPCWYTGVETGEWIKSDSPEARMNRENKRRARGIKPAHLDWYAWQLSTGIYVQFELKVEGRPLRPGQRDTIAALCRNKVPNGVFETVPDVCAFLIDTGFAVHGNARGIAAELHERYLAARRAAVAGRGTAKKRSARKASPRTPVTVKQAHRLGLWRP